MEDGETFDETGDVTKKSYSYSLGKSPRKPVELTILHVVLSRPGIYLREIKSELLELAGVDVSLTSICSFLSVVGFTRQKMKYAALQRDKHLRSQFITDVSIYSVDMLIFLDESGFDK